MPELVATYRVQLHPSFTFGDAGAIADYLSELGASHLYCSPYLQATPGSSHGYDVVDHTRLSDDLGGPQGHEAMVSALGRAGLAHIVDIVPNHMSISSRANRVWWDVLKHGPKSRFAPYFDVDWDPPQRSLRNKILLPVLGDHYGRVLDAGALRIETRDDELVVAYDDLAYPLSPESSEGIDPDAIAHYNRDRDRMHDVLERQHYRLAFWRVGARELDYRRFFDIDTLVALLTERDDVFDHTHGLVLALIEEGKLGGLRIDHIDGLRDPTAYLRKLRDRVGDAYLVVEKIVEPGESLPERWPIDGTTGYEFLNLAGGLFVDPAGEKPLTELYEDFTGRTDELDDIVRRKKLFVAEEVLASDVERLLVLLVRVCERRLAYRDFTRHDLRDALRETIAAFPVYRTYVTERDATPDDLLHIEQALDRVARVRPDIDHELLSFLRDLLSLGLDGDDERELALRFQQTTGAVMAKGVEDTVFYVFNRLLSLNEVGGDPGRFGVSVAEFHDAMAAAQRSWPRSLLTTSTHDTKRSEDVRARVSLLSEVPEKWAAAVRRWAAMNEHHRADGLPDRNMEYLLYQTLVGAHPLPTDRALAYFEKAAKEAKEHTSWVDPDAVYDEALAAFVRGILGEESFTADLAAFVEPLVEPGRIGSLAQVLLKLTCPGVPDIYQGTEVWDASLVDPDNRRPVDHPRIHVLLRAVADARASEVWPDDGTGAAKIFAIHRTLQTRNRHPECFGRDGAYRQLATGGAKADHVVAFVRGDGVVTVVPRLVLGLEEGWGDTWVEMPEGAWDDVLSSRRVGGRVPLSHLLDVFPVALLQRTGVR